MHPAPRSLSWLRAARAWAPTAAWCAVIFVFSSAQFSAGVTGGVLEWLWRTLLGAPEPGTFAAVHLALRKAAHFGAYFILSLLAFYSWRGTMPARSRWLWSALALALCALVAGADEFNQHLTAARTGAFSDVLLDMAGAVAAQVALLLTWRRNS